MSTPEKAWREACRTNLAQDWKTEFACLSPHSQEQMIGQLVFAALWVESDGVPEGVQIATRHGLDMKQLRNLADAEGSNLNAWMQAEDVAIEEVESKNAKDADVSAWMRLANQKIKDRPAFYHDMLTFIWRTRMAEATEDEKRELDVARAAARAGKMKRELVQLKIDGEKATAKVHDGDPANDTEIRFERVAGRWLLDHDPR